MLPKKDFLNITYLYPKFWLRLSMRMTPMRHMKVVLQRKTVRNERFTDLQLGIMCAEWPTYYLASAIQGAGHI